MGVYTLENSFSIICKFKSFLRLLDVIYFKEKNVFLLFICVCTLCVCVCVCQCACVYMTTDTFRSHRG